MLKLRTCALTAFLILNQTCKPLNAEFLNNELTKEEHKRKEIPLRLQDYDVGEITSSEQMESPVIPAMTRARAISDELQKVESLLEEVPPGWNSLSKSVCINSLRNKNLELEFELTRAKIELAQIQSGATPQEEKYKMADDQKPQHMDANVQVQGTSTDPSPPFPPLATLQADKVVQEDLKEQEDSLDELMDPAQKLMESTSISRGKRPLLIPDFVSSTPIVLEGDRETNYEKKPKLNTTFPQWSAANFRIVHTPIKERSLSTVPDIMNYISYSTKVSELPKLYPITR